MSLSQAAANEANSADEPGELHRLSAYCDACFAFYDTIVETTADEEMMHSAQSLTSSALDRIGVLKRVIANE